MCFWNPSREEIQQWVESKEKELIERENINPRFFFEDFLQRYIFTDLHESFFATFPSELHAWLSRLVENETFSRRVKPIDWTLEAIQRLEREDNLISRIVDYWLNSLLEGFVTEFVVDTLKATTKRRSTSLKDIRVST